MGTFSPAAAAQPIMARLKNETRTCHERVEAALDLPSRIRSHTDYETLLVAFYGLYRPLEERLAATPRLAELGLDFATRRKTPSLVADLHALGWSRDRIASLPLYTELPHFDSPAQAGGCAYVVEGATLGGQFISREVARSLNIRDAGAHFFLGYGVRTREQWLGFGSALNAYIQQHPDAADQVVSTAEETFICFEHWLLRARR